MAEVKTPANCYIVHYQCDVCHTGRMITRGMKKQNGKDVLFAECDNEDCRNYVPLDGIYPSTVFEPIQDGTPIYNLSTGIIKGKRKPQSYRVKK